MDLINLYRHQKADLPLCLGSDDCRGKTYIVTGSNIGLGYECAKHLVSFQARRVILAVRSLDRGRAALDAIESETGILGVANVWPLDLSSYDSIKAFVRKVEDELDQVDALVANAAGANSEWTLSEGIETTITVNLVGTLFMGILMLPYLKEKAKTTSTVPIITVVTSDLAFGRKVDLSKINKEEILNDLSNDKKWSIDGTNRYALSKLLQIFAMRQLAKLAPASKTGVIINYVNPGLCNTGLVRYATAGTKMMVNVLRAIMGRSAEWGSRNLLHAISVGEESHGKHLSYCEIDEDVLPTWITGTDGEQWSERVWEQLGKEMERVQPNCVRHALRI